MLPSLLKNKAWTHHKKSFYFATEANFLSYCSYIGWKPVTKISGAALESTIIQIPQWKPQTSTKNLVEWKKSKTTREKSKRRNGSLCCTVGVSLDHRITLCFITLPATLRYAFDSGRCPDTLRSATASLKICRHLDTLLLPPSKFEGSSSRALGHLPDNRKVPGSMPSCGILLLLLPWERNFIPIAPVTQLLNRENIVHVYTRAQLKSTPL